MVVVAVAVAVGAELMGYCSWYGSSSSGGGSGSSKGLSEVQHRSVGAAHRIASHCTPQPRPSPARPSPAQAKQARVSTAQDRFRNCNGVNVLSRQGWRGWFESRACRNVRQVVR